MQLFSELKIPASGNGMCKCPVAGECLKMSMKKQEGHALGLEWASGRTTENSVMGHIGTRSKWPYRLRTSDLILNVILKSNIFFKSLKKHYLILWGSL